MSTRGTYKIDGVLCYNHHDNYPTGVAHHLLTVINKCNRVDLFSCIRGMERLELTNSIFGGPAEYHYVIKEGTIKCYSIPLEKYKDELIPHSGGTIEDWVTEYLFKSKKQHEAYCKRNAGQWGADKPFFDEGEDDRDITIINYRGSYYTKRALENEAIANFKRAKEMFVKGMIGNSSGEFQDIFRMINSAGLELNNMKEDYLSNYADVFAERYGHKTPDHFRGIVNEGLKTETTN
jgi:hypothetical protein